MGSDGVRIQSGATPKIENGVVTEFGFTHDNVTDISPVRALAGLKRLPSTAAVGPNGKLSDLSPLPGCIYMACTDTKSPTCRRFRDALTGSNARNRISRSVAAQGMPLTLLACTHAGC